MMKGWFLLYFMDGHTYSHQVAKLLGAVENDFH